MGLSFSGLLNSYYHETFAEFLCPDSVYELIDYHLLSLKNRSPKIMVPPVEILLLTFPL